MHILEKGKMGINREESRAALDSNESEEDQHKRGIQGDKHIRPQPL